MRRVHGKLDIKLDRNNKLDGRLADAVLAVLHEGVRNGLIEAAPIVQKMPENHIRERKKHFKQFTGNTVASITASVWTRPDPTRAGAVVASVRDEGAPILAQKIGKGRSLHLDNPVEGQPRTVEGTVDLVTESSLALADMTARKSAASRPLQVIAGIVLGSGTEYHKFIDDWASAYMELKNYAGGPLRRRLLWNIARAANNFGK